MSRRQPIPGVDEAALAALADQFPSGSLPPGKPLAQAPAPARDKAPSGRGKAPPVQGEASLGRDTAPLADARLADGSEVVNGAEPLSPILPGAAPRKAPGRGLAVCAMLLAL